MDTKARDEARGCCNSLQYRISTVYDSPRCVRNRLKNIEALYKALGVQVEKMLRDSRLDTQPAARKPPATRPVRPSIARSIAPNNGTVDGTVYELLWSTRTRLLTNDKGE